MRQAAEDVAWVFPPAALNEVEEQHQEQGDAPDTDGGRQAEPEREGDAEEGGVRQRFAEVDEAAPQPMSAPMGAAAVAVVSAQRQGMRMYW